MFDATEITGGREGDGGIEGSLCPEELCRVSHEFGAMDVPYTEQVFVPMYRPGLQHEVLLDAAYSFSIYR